VLFPIGLFILIFYCYRYIIRKTKQREMKSAVVLRYAKWSVFIYCCLFLILNYYAIVEVVDSTFLKWLDNFLLQKGYSFSVREPLSYLLKFAPGLSLVTYIVDLNKKTISSELKRYYTIVTIMQLLFLSVSLSLLLYFQNVFNKRHIINK